jgi:hypothetical protein
MKANIIYDFTIYKDIYVKKCIPVLKYMYDNGLIDTLLSIKTYEDVEKYRHINGWKKAIFGYTDYKHLVFCQPLLKYVELCRGEVEIVSHVNMKRLAKLISKVYLIDMEKETRKKVTCDIYIHSKTHVYQLLVNCYDYMKDGEYAFKSPKGSIKTNENENDALIREMYEELGFKFDISKYKLILNGKNSTRYRIDLSYDDFKYWYRNVTASKISYEITKIGLFQINPLCSTI